MKFSTCLAQVCLGWELRSRSWGFLLARARALGAEDTPCTKKSVPSGSDMWMRVYVLRTD